MSKIALLTDNHHGVRGENPFFLEKAEKFFSEQFFPYLIKNNIKEIIHLGDILDKRKSVSFVVASSLRKFFIEPILTNDLRCSIIQGNHDAYYKSTNEIFGFAELFDIDASYISCYSATSEVFIEDNKFLFIPWINSENREETISKITNSNCKYVFGHLELNGYTMYKGSICHEGDDPAIFRKFQKVFSGHFHSKSNKDNIYYLGSPFEMTWADYDDPKGFHIFDTETGEIEFIENKDKVYHKIIYDDTSLSLKELKKLDFNLYSNTIVKLIVQTKSNVKLFDLFVEKLENVCPYELTIVEDSVGYNLSEATNIEVNLDTEDTFSTMKKSLPNVFENDIQQKKLETVIMELYKEASMLA